MLFTLDCRMLFRQIAEHRPETENLTQVRGEGLGKIHSGVSQIEPSVLFEAHYQKNFVDSTSSLLLKFRFVHSRVLEPIFS